MQERRADRVLEVGEQIEQVGAEGADGEVVAPGVAQLSEPDGLGRCSAVYAGPTDTSVLPEAVDTIDPNGLAGQSLVTLLTGLIP